jgi:antitoxin component of MazEF toxin-antitoxin module
MQIKVERTLLRVGEDSFAVTLPKAWISYKQLKHGDVVEVTVNDDIIIRAMTASQEEAEAKNYYGGH